MISVDMKGLLLRLNDYCTNQLHAAAGLSVSLTNYEITVEHFLYINCSRITSLIFP